jgi:hypothetical protein
MAYETKAILIAIGKLIKKAESLEDAYKSVADMANAEGVILEPYDKDKEKE